MTITYAIYLYRGGADVYPDEPDFTRDVEVDLDALERRGGAKYATFEADLDGDGIRDMVARESHDSIRIVPGGIESSFFSGKQLTFVESRATTVDVPANGDLEVRSLFGDARDQLVITSPGQEDPERAKLRIVEVIK
jgi:hypothetical protein